MKDDTKFKADPYNFNYLLYVQLLNLNLGVFEFELVSLDYKQDAFQLQKSIHFK